jgi:hypothetical protein
MNARLQGFLDFLDLMAEGSRRQAELIAGRELRPEPGLQPVVIPARRKFPLTAHQKSRLFDTPRTSRVSIKH